MNLDKIIREEIAKLNESSLNVSKFGDALARVESGGGDYSAENPKSSAVGKYQFLWNTHGKAIERITGVKSKKEFKNSPEAQEKFFKYWFDTTLQPNINRLKQKSNKSDAALAALVHYQGPAGADRYIKSGTETSPEINMPVEKYLDRVEQAYYGKEQSDNDTINSKDLESDVETETDYNPEVPTAEDLMTGDMEKLIDDIQFYVSFLGFVPFVGDAIDIINGIVYLIRGKLLDAALSGIAIIPVVGSMLATPVKLAIKAGRQVLKPNVLKAAIQTGRGWDTIWHILANSDNLGKYAISPKTLDTLASGLDEVTLLITDTTKKMSSLPGMSQDAIQLIASKGDEFAKLIDNMAEGAAKAADDIANRGVKSIDLNMVAAAGTVTKKQITKAVTNTISNGFIGKLVKGTISTAIPLGRLKTSKNILELSAKYQDDFAKLLFQGQGFDSLAKSALKQMTPGEIKNIAQQLKSTLPTLARGQAQPAFLRNPSVQNIVGYLNTMPNSSKSAAFKIFKESSEQFSKGFLIRQQAFVTRELTKLTNISKQFSPKTLLKNVANASTLGNNVYKIHTKLYYGGIALEELSENSTGSIGKAVNSLGGLMQQASIAELKFIGLISTDTPDERLQKEILRQQDEIAGISNELRKAYDEILKIDVDNLTQADVDLINKVTELQKEDNQ